MPTNAVPKVTAEAKIPISHGLTKGQLQSLLEMVGIPEHAQMRVHHRNGDPRNQRDSDYTELVFTWEV